MKMKMACLLLFFLFAFPVSHSSPFSYSDKDALLAFKSSLSPDSHKVLHDWSSDSSLCNWTGVSCSSRHQRVVSLNLTGDDMTPYIADFGITRLFFENSMNSVTSASVLKGSIGYFAPEYGMGGKISTKGDVYSYEFYF
ncbi:hypothetical protein SUGI_1143070 [Cryptomeria japonica]|nr:hypothetical protein SUGI_1143070 [Cryptomeria japonica]